MSDLIKRDEVIKALRLEYPMMPLFKSLREEWAIKTEGFRKAEEVIMKLPSADRPQGEWIYCEDYVGHDGYECSNCRFFIPWVYDYYADSNFILNYHTCPHCDARMKEQKITE